MDQESTELKRAGLLDAKKPPHDSAELKRALKEARGIVRELLAWQVKTVGISEVQAWCNRKDIKWLWHLTRGLK